ncbi:hypothetical protein QE177_14815 (plasmid) [Arsenophonus sp. aPb]|uniref:hypothetical protein n=1 Tax=Arsenophonus sp. aPb TaxID=3041619 RepID=UPI0024694430|nr:hypothetical protein [Arsenophonus sp. aPb]WGL99783.1 hypothetical protein QE177_14815 [Arsenophonus sp. aPb]
MRILLLFTFIFYSLGYSAITFAGCNAIGSNLVINGDDLDIKDDIPIGTELATFTLNSSQTYTCDNNQTSYMTTGGRVNGEFATDISGIRVYKTNIEGIGYSFGVQTMCGDMYFPSNGWKGNLDNISNCTNSGSWDNISHNFAVKIYKIGPTGSGAFSKKQVGATLLFYDNENVSAKENPVFLNDFKVTTMMNIKKNNSNWVNNNNNNNNNSRGGWVNNNNNNNNGGGWVNNNNNNNNGGGWVNNNNNNNNGGWINNNNNNNNNN